MLDTAISVCKRLQEHGFQAVFAGGYVRDFLLGKEYNDIDIATNATPKQIKEVFEKVIPIGESFGVMQVHIGGHQFEVATFRNDVTYSDGRRPDSITFSSMKEDALRRDFTINALFYDPLSDTVFDFVCGERDLGDKILRFVGDPNKRLEEDQLRALRAVRFASRMGLELERKTKEALEVADVNKISAERIKMELDKMLQNKKPSVAFVLMVETGLLRKVLPEVDPLVKAKHNRNYHDEGEPWEHTLIVLDSVRKETDDLNVLWAALLHDVGKPLTELHEEGKITNHGHDKIGASVAVNLLTRLKAPSAQIKEVEFLILQHMRIKDVSTMKKSKVARLKANKYFSNLKLLATSDSKASSVDGRLDWVKGLDRVEEYKELPKPLINGMDLTSIGVEEGPRMGAILKHLMDLQLEGVFSNKKEALIFIRRNNLEEK